MYDIVVVGGGLVGNAFALDLITKSPQLNICIIDKCISVVNHEAYDSRIYAINAANLKYFASIGLKLDFARIADIKQMDIYGDNNSFVNLSADEIKRDYLAKTIEYQNIQKALSDELQHYSNISLVYGDIISIENNGDVSPVVLSIDRDGVIDKIEARLLVAADGANSFVRQYFDMTMAEIDYQQLGVVANFGVSVPHNDVASQWFLEDGSVLAFLPLPNDCISIVYSTHDASCVTSLSASDIEQLFYDLSNGKLGKLELLNKPNAIPLKLKLVERFYTKNVVLIGDAAHTIHPLAGLGVNLGFEDASVLAQLLSTSKTFQYNDEGLLLIYHNKRYLAVRKMQMICHGLYRLFNANGQVLGFIRNFGINKLNAVNYLKKIVIKQVI